MLASIPLRRSIHRSRACTRIRFSFRYLRTTGERGRLRRICPCHKDREPLHTRGNRRLGVALHLQAYSALSGSAGARAYYVTLRARNIGHHAALRQLANRLVGILHGCLKTGTKYNEDTAWAHRRTDTETVAA